MMKIFLTLLLFPVGAFAALSDLDKADLSSTNTLKNSGFESGFAEWAKTGGTWTLQTSGSKLGFGKQSLCWDSSAAAQKLQSSVVTIPNALKGKNGEYKISILTPTGTSTHKLRITDGTNPIGQDINVYTATIFQSHGTNFPIPTSGGIRIELESVASNEPEICLDLSYVGEATNLQTVAQAKHVGILKYAAATSCAWELTSTSYASFSADTDCSTPTVDGDLQAPATKIPAFKMNVTAGSVYRITAKSLFNFAIGFSSFRFNDGTDSSELAGGGNGTSGVVEGYNGSITSIYKPTTSGLKTIEIQAKAPSSPSRIIADVADLVFEVEQFPSQSQLAVNSLNADYGRTAYTPTITGFGTATGVNCFHEKHGENLVVNCNFTAGTTTGVEARVSIPSGLVSSSSLPSLSVAGHGARTLATSDVIISLIEPSVSYITFGEGSTSNSTASFSKLNGNQIVGTGESVSFKAIIPISGWAVTQNAPVLIGSVTSGAANALRIESAFVSSTGTVSNESSDFLNSDCTNATPTVCTFNSGMWSSTPNCQITRGSIAPANDTPGIATISTTTLSYSFHRTGTGELQGDAVILCMGSR